MTSSPALASTSIIPQSKNRSKPSPTTFASLPRELRDMIYRYIVIAEDGVVAVTACATDYGNCKGIEAIRTILHASTSTTQFAREAYEMFFHQNTFHIASQALPEFVNRKTHHLKNEGSFDVNAWVGCLEVIIHESFCPHREVRNGLANELRQLLVCPRLHAVSIQIECSQLRNEEELHDHLRAIAEVCAQLRGKIGGRFKVETNGKEDWGNEKRQPLSPWNLSPVESARRAAPSN